MQFAPPRPRQKPESIVPMINVVFLLLIFFLMTATLAPPEPFETMPPVSGLAEAADPEEPLFIGPAGELAYGAARGEAVYSAVAVSERDGQPLYLRADAGLPAAELAAVLARLQASGVSDVRLIAVMQ